MTQNPQIRIVLVHAWSLAAGGNLGQALSLLDNHVGSVKVPVDRAALLNCKARLVYLNGQPGDAAQILDQLDEELLKQLPTDVSLTLAENRALAATDALMPQGVADFYSIADQRRMVGMSVRDSGRTRAGISYARAGKHYDAWPLFWQNLLDAYDAGSWLAMASASEELARECIETNNPLGALWYTILSCGTATVGPTSDLLIHGRDLATISRAIEIMLSQSGLARNALVTCKALVGLADFIPAEELPKVIAWLIPICIRQPTNWGEQAACVAGWEAAEAIAPRLKSREAIKLIETAFQHPAWRSQPVLRRHLIAAVNRCLEAIPKLALKPLVAPIIEAVTTTKSEIDYIEGVNLATHLAVRSPASLRAKLADAIVPKGSPLGPVLAQVAPHFGRKPVAGPGLNAQAMRVAEHVRLQVQRLKPGEAPAKLGGFGTHSHEENGKTVVVHMGSSEYELGALVANRSALGNKAVEALADAILHTIKDTDNTVANRFSLINTLGDFADRLTRGVANRAVRQLLSFASGKCIAESERVAEARAKDPFNRVRISQGELADMQGIAAFTIARIAKARPGVQNGVIESAIVAAMTNPNDVVRRYGFAAARELPKLSPGILNALLLGTRDANPDSGARAFETLASRAGLSIDKDAQMMLAYSLSMAQSSSSVALRRTAARAALAIERANPIEEVRRTVRELRAHFANDVSYSVRNAVARSS